MTDTGVDTCTWRVDEAASQLKISFVGASVSTDLVADVLNTESPMWMSKHLKTYTGPSAEELLLQGEWIWSQDGSE